MVVGSGPDRVVLRAQAAIAGGLALLPVPFAQELAVVLAARPVMVLEEVYAALVPDGGLVAGFVAEIGSLSIVQEPCGPLMTSPGAWASWSSIIQPLYYPEICGSGEGP